MIKTPCEMAEAFIGVAEVQGMLDNPLILAFLKTDSDWPTHDETPWCSGFVNFVSKCCRVMRSRSLAARSWLSVGEVVEIDSAVMGFDVVILERGSGGHVGFFLRYQDDSVWLRGGNQGDRVSDAKFEKIRILGVRRLS